MKTRNLTLIIFLFGISLHAQDPARYFPDTVWLKSGEVIPCIISSIDPTSNRITIQYNDANGLLSFEPMSLELVKTYITGTVINPNDTIREKKKIMLPDSLKYLKAYFGFGFGFPLTGGLSLTVILKNDWGGSLSYKHTSYDKRDKSGKTGGIFGPGFIPGDQITEISLSAVKEFPASVGKRVRFGLEFGPSLVYYSKVENIQIQSAWIFGSYYSAEYTDYTTVGINLRAKLEFPVSRVFGFEVAVYSNINPHKPHAGIEFYLTIGRVRDRLRPK